MGFSWKSRMLFILALVLFSVYQLAPTLMGLKEKREQLALAKTPEPWYFSVLPQQELNLGLDLRGGLYLELSVDIEEATRHQVTQLLSDINRNVIKTKFENIHLTHVGQNLIRIEVAPKDKDAFLTAMHGAYNEKTLIEKTSAAELLFTFTSDFNLARKNVADALKKANLTADVNPTSDNKRLGIVAIDPGQKTLVTQALAAAGADKDVAPASSDDLVYFQVSDAYFASLQSDTLEQAANSVRNRIDRFGVVEANVSKLGNARLAIELPGVKNPDQVIDIIRRTGKLEFRLTDNAVNPAELSQKIEAKKQELGITVEYEREAVKKLNEALKAELPPDTSIAFELVRNKIDKKVTHATPHLLTNNVTVTGDMLSNAKVDSYNGQPVVSMSFNKTGTENFGELTKENIGRNLAIVLDGIVMSSPRINTAITGGDAQIELGMGTYESLQREASDLVLILREGSLPASLTVESKSIIGPSLGQASIDAGLKSMMIAAIAVVIFMMLYYRAGGVIANIGLAINVLFIFAVLCVFQASLSLPGIAGIVLTMGIAVDANVLIFERMREEIIYGKSVSEVIRAGYEHAMSAIVDGNVSTFISGLVLFQFGTGPVKGFATTLMIGILTTMFTAIFVTRVLYDWLIESVGIKKLSV